MKIPAFLDPVRGKLRLALKWLFAVEKRALRAAALTAAVLTVLTGSMGLSRCSAPLRTLSYDIPFRMHQAAGEGAGNVGLVYIDEFRGGRLSREQQAALLDKLGAVGVRAVLYDIFFDEPSQDPKTDADFASAIIRFRGLDADGKPLPGQPQRYVFLACARHQFTGTGIVGEQLIPPTDALLTAADDIGLVIYLPDEGYYVRELTTGTRDEASVPWKAAAALGAKLEEPERMAPRWINFAGKPQEAFRNYNASDILKDGAPESLRDNIVIVGGAPGVAGAALGQDLFNTPYNRFDSRGTEPRMSGPELQAHTLSNLLLGNWLTRSGSGFDGWLILLTGVLAGGGLTLLRLQWMLPAALLAAGAFFWWGVSSVHHQQWWFPWTVPAFLQIPAGCVFAVTARSIVERRFKALIDDAFKKYVSPGMLARITARGVQPDLSLKLQPAVLMITSLDTPVIAGLTDAVAEKRADALNTYFSDTTKHIFQTEGSIIKFMGERIFAAWGAPEPGMDDQLHAVKSAWELHMQSTRVGTSGPVHTRAALHDGEVLAGNVGSTHRMEYSLLGPAVETVEMMAQLHTVLRVPVLISGKLAAKAEPLFLLRRIGRIRFRRGGEAVELHEIIGPRDGFALRSWDPVYQEALKALEADDDRRAEKLFTAVSAECSGGDGPSEYFLACLRSGVPIVGGCVERPAL